MALHEQARQDALAKAFPIGAGTLPRPPQPFYWWAFYRNLYELGYKPWEACRVTLPEYAMLVTKLEDSTPTGHPNLAKNEGAAKAEAQRFNQMSWLDKLRNFERNY